MQLSLPEGVTVEVAVCNVQTPSHFFVQLPDNPTFKTLAPLHASMQQVYNVPTGVPPIQRPIESRFFIYPMILSIELSLAVNICCVAPLVTAGVFNGWYRAVVSAYDAATDECIVKLLDYGGYITVPVSQLRQIR